MVCKGTCHNSCCWNRLSACIDVANAVLVSADAFVRSVLRTLPFSPESKGFPPGKFHQPAWGYFPNARGEDHGAYCRRCN